MVYASENLYLGAGLTTPGPDRLHYLSVDCKVIHEWGCLGS